MGKKEMGPKERQLREMREARQADAAARARSVQVEKRPKPTKQVEEQVETLREEIANAEEDTKPKRGRKRPAKENSRGEDGPGMWQLTGDVPEEASE